MKAISIQCRLIQKPILKWLFLAINLKVSVQSNVISWSMVCCKMIWLMVFMP
ncbi:UNVERIFIED_CONTAM: hypothetical protein GTU68_036442 [Idotea baltica]|nr:hypothetical protein [Idotea baltica]